MVIPISNISMYNTIMKIIWLHSNLMLTSLYSNLKYSFQRFWTNITEYFKTPLKIWLIQLDVRNSKTNKNHNWDFWILVAIFKFLQNYLLGDKQPLRWVVGMIMGPILGLDPYNLYRVMAALMHTMFATHQWFALC